MIQGDTRIFLYGVQGVVSSNPAIPTNKNKGLSSQGGKPLLLFVCLLSLTPTPTPTKYFAITSNEAFCLLLHYAVQSACARNWNLAY